jgi:hypothetical protein
VALARGQRPVAVGARAFEVVRVVLPMRRLRDAFEVMHFRRCREPAQTPTGLAQRRFRQLG